MARPKGTGGRAPELSPQQVREISSILRRGPQGSRNLTLFLLGLGTGMRIGEICSLRIGDVTNGREINRRITLEKHRTKTKTSRTVAVTEQARKALSRFLGSDLGTLDRRSPLFPSRQNPSKAISNAMAAKFLHQAFVCAGIPQGKTHSMRRSHANSLRRSGADLKLIQIQLGHSSIMTTQQYLSVDPEEQLAAVVNLKF